VPIDSPGLDRSPRGGVYVLLVALGRGRRLRVGRLGERTFPRGWYLYVGSAQRGLKARLRRHTGRRKRRRWHIDYLTTVGEVAGAWVAGAGKPTECALARCLGEAAEVVSGFGSSDCRCPGHLFHTAARGSAEALVALSWSTVRDSLRGRGGCLFWWPAEIL